MTSRDVREEWIAQVALWQYASGKTWRHIAVDALEEIDNRLEGTGRVERLEDTDEETTEMHPLEQSSESISSQGIASRS